LYWTLVCDIADERNSTESEFNITVIRGLD